MSGCDCDQAPAGPEPKGTAYAKVLPMLAGAKASDASVSAALLVQARKQQIWLDRRGKLDAGARELVEARAAGDAARVRATTDQLFAFASIPEADEKAMTIGGRVTREGKGEEGLAVSALDRSGKARGCDLTDARGMYRIVLEGDGEALLQVTTAGGRKQLYLDDRPIALEPGAVAVRNIELSGKDTRTCPDGPDTSNRIVMPDLVGKPVDEAVKELRASKIELAGRRTVVRTGFEDRVVATEPEAGRLLEDPPKAVLTIGVRGEQQPEPKASREKPVEKVSDRSKDTPKSSAASRAAAAASSPSKASEPKASSAASAATRAAKAPTRPAPAKPAPRKD